MAKQKSIRAYSVLVRGLFIFCLLGLGLAGLSFFNTGIIPDIRAVIPARQELPEIFDPGWHILENTLEKRAKKFRGRAFYFIKDLGTGRTISLNAEMPVPSASLVKLPIMLSVYEKEKEGEAAFDDRLTLNRKDRAAGCGVLKRYHNGKKFTLLQLLDLMITRSDNTATNMLTGFVGMEFVNEVCRRHGYFGTNMVRKVMDLELRNRGIENLTTAKDLGMLLEDLYSGRMMDEETSSQMLDILKRQKVRDRLPRFLPKGTVVANKTGLMNELCHDAGIIYLQNGNYVVCVLTSNFRTFGSSKSFIGRIARDIYDYDLSKKDSPGRKVGRDTAIQPTEKAPGG